MGWHVAGGGAMGSLWSARLARAGEKVTLLLRSRHRRAIPRSSLADPGWNPPANPATHLRVSSAGEGDDFSVEVPTGVATDSEPIERLLLAVKAHDLRSAIRQLKPRLKDASAVVILCQQPAVFEEIMRDHELSQGMPFVLGTTSHNACSTQHFHVVHASPHQGSSWFGLPRQGEVGHEPRGLMSSAELKAVTDSLGKAGLGAYPVQDMIPILWTRLALSCGINPLTALFQCTNDALQESEACQNMMQKVVEEVMTVMDACGVIPEGGMTAESLYQAALQVSSQAKGHFSSMCMDVRLGRRTEIDYFNGFVAKKAHEKGLHVPVNELLHALITARGELLTKEDMGMRW